MGWESWKARQNPHTLNVLHGMALLAFTICVMLALWLYGRAEPTMETDLSRWRERGEVAEGKVTWYRYRGPGTTGAGNYLTFKYTVAGIERDGELRLNSGPGLAPSYFRQVYEGTPVTVLYLSDDPLRIRPRLGQVSKEAILADLSEAEEATRPAELERAREHRHVPFWIASPFAALFLYGGIRLLILGLLKRET